MTVVVDVGCARYGGDYSIERLLEEFKPKLLLGLDPNAQWEGERELDGCRVMLWQAAAANFDGEIEFIDDGLGSRIQGGAGSRMVPCFDLARVLTELIEHAPEGERFILKIDAEGAEYDLLENLLNHGLDERLELAWVEWHCTQCHRGWIGNHTAECPGDPVGDRRREWTFANWAGELREWKY